MLEFFQSKSRLQSNLVSWFIFLATLIVVLINLVSVVFPSLFVVSLGGFPNYGGVNIFETGIWTYPLLITNFAVFAIAVLFYKNKIPLAITKIIRFIFDFEVSSGMAFVVVTIMIGFYATFTVNEVFTEDPWEDYQSAKYSIEHWSLDGGKGLLSVKYFLLYDSFYLLKNVRAIPFVASIALVILTYLVTERITKKRFAGIVAISIVLSSHIFLLYSTTASYANFWIMLYLLSLYLVYRKWQFSAISYILSFLSKGLTLVYLPLSLFFIYKADISRKMKIGAAISYGIIIGILVTIASSPLTSYLIPPVSFNYHDFIDGFSALAIQLRSDGLVLLFLLPLIVGLFIATRRQVHGAESTLVLILGVLISVPLLYGFADITIQPYRFIALIVFFAIGTGCLLSKNYDKGRNIVKNMVAESPGNTG